MLFSSGYDDLYLARALNPVDLNKHLLPPVGKFVDFVYLIAPLKI